MLIAIAATLEYNAKAPISEGEYSLETIGETKIGIV